MSQDITQVRDERNTKRSPKGHWNRRNRQPNQNAPAASLSKRGGKSAAGKSTSARPTITAGEQGRMLPYNGERAMVTVERLMGEPVPDAAICKLRGFIGKLALRDLDEGTPDPECQAWLAGLKAGDELSHLEVFAVRWQDGRLRFKLRPQAISTEVPMSPPQPPRVRAVTPGKQAQSARPMTEAEKVEALRRKTSVGAVVVAVGEHEIAVRIGPHAARIAANQLDGRNPAQREARKTAIKKGDVLNVAITSVVPDVVSAAFDIRCSERVAALGHFFEHARRQQIVIGKVDQVTLDGVWMRFAGRYFGFVKRGDADLRCKPGNRLQVKVTGIVKTGRPHLTLVRQGQSA